MAVGMRDALDLRYHIKVFPRHTRQSVTAHEPAPYDELYAARSRDFCWWRLSGFEFVRHWMARPVLPPPEAQKPKTRWREGMSDWFDAELRAGRKPVARAGTHYDLDPDELGEFYRVDESLKTKKPTLFENWVLCRREVPCVPVIENCRVPRCDGAGDENGQYFLIFFHPWTSIPALADEFVPLLGHLGHTTYVKRRNSTKQQPRPETNSVDFAACWGSFKRSGQMSRCATRYARNLLKATLNQRSVSGPDALV